MIELRIYPASQAQISSHPVWGRIHSSTIREYMGQGALLTEFAIALLMLSMTHRSLS